MLRRAVTLLLPAACASLLVAGLHVHTTAAAFTAQKVVGSNTLTVDKLANYFVVTPGTAVQAGTSTPVASGGVDTLALVFGTVPKAQTFTALFTIRNVAAQTQTANLTLTAVPQVALSATSVTLAAGESTTISATTSATIAGRASGTLRLALSGIGWLYRTYPVSIAEAPEAPPSLAATARAAGRIALAWGASTTTTNLAGYDVLRVSGGGSYTKLNASPLAGTSYDDTVPSTVDGTTYTYKIQAVSTDALPLWSLDSPTATATADATPPAQPTAVSLTNGAGWINGGTAATVNVSVSLPAGSLASDTVTVTLSSGGQTVSKTAAATGGAGSVTVSNIDASILPDGTVTIAATSTDLAGNVSTARSTTAPKDTTAPAIASVTYVDNKNPTQDQVIVSTEAGATVTVSIRGLNPSGTADASGTFTASVGSVKTGSGTISVTAHDAAGNASSAGDSWSDSK